MKSGKKKSVEEIMCSFFACTTSNCIIFENVDIGGGREEKIERYFVRLDISSLVVNVVSIWSINTVGLKWRLKMENICFESTE